MPMPVENLRRPEDDLLRTYLRTLSRSGRTQPLPGIGSQWRTCANCGQRTIFLQEPGGTWFRCRACGRYA